MSTNVWRFYDFELDLNASRLSRKGDIVHLERIPLELLCLLFERCGQTVTRDQILERIWGKTVFIDSENAINKAVRKIRRALNDDVNAPRFIFTIPGKGYRFIAAASESGATATLIRQSESAATDHGSRKIPMTDSQAGERRHLTVLVCELMAAAGPAPQFDPEERWKNVGDYHRAAVHSIELYGGHVGPYRGDAMMAYFGWPRAHDNDAERAVRTALAIIEGIARLNERSSGPKLSPRIGIDSGVVVLVANSEQNVDLFGDAPSIAVGLQRAAPPGTVLMTAATHRLLSGLFAVEDYGTRQRDGNEPPIKVYRAILPRRVRGRLEAVAAAGGLTPFVGREDELRLLMNRWERTLAGEGQAALIFGEPGIGKSRLVQHFHQQIAATSYT